MITHIRSIVSRCHVAQSNREVIRFVRSKIKPSFWQSKGRGFRRTVMRAAILEHARNRGLYTFVMTGGVSK